jgi:hypothetical protein
MEHSTTAVAQVAYARLALDVIQQCAPHLCATQQISLVGSFHTLTPHVVLQALT